MSKCKDCDGKGFRYCPIDTRCHTCQGTGQVEKEYVCPVCEDPTCKARYEE